ncbi:MAG: hypothetical protein COV29_01980 [Candidatus Yanofskybacteria bacterium CG10_big_fil_rev_8_21_14_0_10_36_16]|uniref:Uncharacterized protein n=1 Tax=Candidatus Yanofskybacteria bacterium CG10_big_fil_rev_8_21_14_0_10_36_16 TaxID=1975096 RepID=A0A2J0Q7G9_9BACT|nr:MAG: hypothetical protein COV29_01980 [Candidatus Yanofskybacteria bacterium CG10_big_fil_rev_8_21_14_0_10_36_16]
MTPDIIRAIGIRRKDLELFYKIESVIQNCGDVMLDSDRLVSCHMVTRALAKFFQLKYVDGHFGDGAWEHSWLILGKDLIIDAYPWSMVGGPTLVHVGLMSPWRRLYTEFEIPRLKKDTFKKDTIKVTEEIEKTIKRLGISI